MRCVHPDLAETGIMRLLNQLYFLLFRRKWDDPSSDSCEAATFERIALRKAQRLQEGFVWSERMLTPRACSIRDASATGARVDIWDETVKPSLLGGDLTLYFCGDRNEVDCSAMWRKGHSIGLRFTSRFRPPTRRYG